MIYGTTREQDKNLKKFRKGLRRILAQPFNTPSLREHYRAYEGKVHPYSYQGFAIARVADDAELERFYDGLKRIEGVGIFNKLMLAYNNLRVHF